jgi:putative ABC transport system permease protein
MSMLAITLADLRFRYHQFLIAVVGAGVVLAMAVLLSGLAHGFRTEVEHTVGAVGADTWVLSEQAHGRITSVSAIDAGAVDSIRQEPGVTAADGVALLPQEVMRSGEREVTVTVFAVTPGGLGAPVVSDGRPLLGSGEVVVDVRSKVAANAEVRFGSATFRVVGTVHDRTLNGGVPVVYLPLEDAQRILLGARPVVTAVVTRGAPAQVPSGLVVLSNDEVTDASLATLTAAVQSIEKSRSMMWVIAAIIVAALIYVSALQRVRDFAVLKALGSSSRALFASLCLQAVIVTLLGAALGMALSTFMTGVFSQPVAVPASAYATLPLVAVTVGVVASLVALRQATGADPARAFAG